MPLIVLLAALIASHDAALALQQLPRRRDDYLLILEYSH